MSNKHIENVRCDHCENESLFDMQIEKTTEEIEVWKCLKCRKDTEIKKEK